MATYYCATDGDDGNPGTLEAPWKSPRACVSRLLPGDTLYLRAGTYNESIEAVYPGTDWDHPVTVAGAPGEVAVLKAHQTAEDPPQPWDDVVLLANPAQQFIVIRDLVLDGTYTDRSVVRVSHTGTFDACAHDIRIQNCEIRNGGNQGVAIQGSGCRVELLDCWIHHNGLTQTDPAYPPHRCHGIYIIGPGNRVAGCTIEYSGSHGIHNYGEDPEPLSSSNVYERNVIRNNGEFGIILAHGDGCVVRNCLVYGNPFNQLYCEYGATNARLLNNTVSRGDKGIALYPTSSGTVVRNNVGWGCSGGNFEDFGVATEADHNLWENPLFADPSQGDFRPGDGSLALDTGASIAEVTEDLLGTARPQGDGCDLGCYEIVPPPPVVLVPLPDDPARRYAAAAQALSMPPLPDGKLTRGDRAQLAGVYRALYWEEPAPANVLGRLELEPSTWRAVPASTAWKIQPVPPTGAI